jgi:hypothetical protein
MWPDDGGRCDNYYSARLVHYVLDIQDPFWDSEIGGQARREDRETDATRNNITHGLQGRSNAAPSPVCSATNHHRCDVGLLRQVQVLTSSGFLVLGGFGAGDHTQMALPSAQCDLQYPEQDFSQTSSEISIARAAFTTPTWPCSRCSRFESDVSTVSNRWSLSQIAWRDLG